jgi:signal transduction histidine kinase
MVDCGNMNAIRRTPRIRNLLVFSAVIMVLFLGIVVHQARQSYKVALENGRQNAERLSRIVSDHVELTFLAADLTLRRVVERQYFNNLFGGAIPEDLLHNLRLWVDQTPQIAAMLVVNEKGESLVAAHKAGYRDWMDYENFDFRTAPFFYQMREASDRYFWISTLARSAGFNRDLILVSRKLNKIDGEFGGMVMAAIDPQYFMDFFDSVSSRRLGGMMALTLADGTMLVQAKDDGTGSKDLLPRIYEDFTRKGETDTLRSGIGSAQGHQKIFAYRSLRNLPLLVTVVLDEDDFLAEWWQTRIKDIGFLAIFVIFGSVLSFFAVTMARQIMRVEESEAAAVLASQAKSEFLANMSHELRTPLNAIIGFSEMLNSGYFGPLNPRQKERINDINLCGGHLLQLITDILEFSKGEAGKLELNDEKLNLTEIVNETLRMMNEKIRGKHIHLGVEIERNLPRIWGDKRKIRQILLNLLSNAIKFTPEQGTVKIVLWLDSSRNMVMIVSDTGVGIPEDQLATALAVFGQVHRDQSHEGTGLGLPLCKMFAELHGGRLAIGSTPGEGTTVRITLPASRLIIGEPEQIKEVVAADAAHNSDTAEA